MRRAVFVIILVSASAVTAQTQTDLDKARDAIFDGVNKLRAKGELTALKRNSTLDDVAQKHAENMAKQDKLSHKLDDKMNKDRCDDAGYKYVLLAENLAEDSPAGGKSTAAKVVSKIVPGWDKSPGHHKILMMAEFEETGIGLAQAKNGKWYAVQIFGKPPPSK
jgi:uncharacterized protein YkwD